MKYVLLAIVLSCSLFPCHTFYTPSLAPRYRMGQRIQGRLFAVMDTPRSTSADADAPMDDIAKARQLLSQAKKLREQANSDETQVHTTLLHKKRMQDEETDAIIQHVFLSNEHDPTSPLVTPKITAARIHSKRLSLPCLERIVDRLQFLESEAVQGRDHMQHSKKKKESTLLWMDNKIQPMRRLLLDAAQVLDEGTEQDSSHQSCRWVAGKLYASLNERVHFLQREHEAQFRKRQEEFFQAAKRKKHFNEVGGEGFSGLHSIYHGKEEDEDTKR